MRAPSRALGALALLALCACPQSGLGGSASTGSSGATTAGATAAASTAGSVASATSGAGGPSTGGSTGTSSGPATSTTAGGTSGTTGGPTTTGGPSSSSSSGATSGTTGATCLENGAGTPTLSCHLAAPAHWAIAGEAVEVDCDVGAGEAVDHWEAAAAPGPATIDSRALLASHKLWVTYRAVDLPPLFSDTTSTVTVTAHFCNAAPAQAQVSYPVVGNTLVADGAAGVLSFASDASQVGAYLGPAAIQTPSMVYRLPGGNYLVGCKMGQCTKPLQVFDPQGNHLFDFDTANHGGGDLWPIDVRPWAAAVDDQGRIWVTGFKQQTGGGVVHVFDASGIFVDTAVEPADPTQAISWWVPLGVARLGNGTMAVAMGGANAGEPYLALYTSPSLASLVRLTWDECTDSGTGTPTCHTSQYGNGAVAGLLVQNGEVIISTTYETPANMIAYGDPGLGVLRASVKGSGGSDNWYNAWLGQVVPFGDRLLVGPVLSYDCISIVDAQTLYAPASWPANRNGCWLSSGGSSSRYGLYHLTAP